MRHRADRVRSVLAGAGLLAACCGSAAAALAHAGGGPRSMSEQPAAAATIHERVAARIASFGGTMGVAAIDLASGEQIAIAAETRFPTASLIKVPVLVEVFHRIAAGTLRRDTPITLHQGDKVGDEAVVLNQLHDGLIVTVADLLALMTAYSDNTATNLLIAQVGTARVNARMEAYGLTHTKLFRPTFRDGRADVLPELEREFGLGLTTPLEMARLFAAMARGDMVSRAISDEMIALMDRQQDRAMIPRSLPMGRDGIQVANKTGWDEEKTVDASGVRGHIRTDAAFVRGPGRGDSGGAGPVRYVIAICARRVRDTDWGVDNEALRTGAAISREIYDYFAAKHAAR